MYFHFDIAVVNKYIINKYIISKKNKHSVLTPCNVNQYTSKWRRGAVFDRNCFFFRSTSLLP